MTTFQIQPFQDRVNAWDNGGKQAWINKNYPGFVDHFNSELVERIREAKSKINHKNK